MSKFQLVESPGGPLGDVVVGEPPAIGTTFTRDGREYVVKVAAPGDVFRDERGRPLEHSVVFVSPSKAQKARDALARQRERDAEMIETIRDELRLGTTERKTPMAKKFALYETNRRISEFREWDSPAVGEKVAVDGKDFRVKSVRPVRATEVEPDHLAVDLELAGAAPPPARVSPEVESIRRELRL